MFYSYERLHGFYVHYPERLDPCMNATIHNGITLQRFVRAGKMFKQFHNLKKVIGGQPSLLIDYLYAREEELDEVTREQVQILIETLREYFQKEARIFKRLAYVSTQTVELLRKKNGTYIEMSLGTWGKFDDLLQLYGYYKRHGFHWNNAVEKTPHCRASELLIRLRRPNNTALLTDTINKIWQQWSSLSRRSDGKGYMKRVQNLVEGKVEGITTAQKLVEIARVLHAFTSNPKQRTTLMETEIPGWGTIKEFLDCQDVPESNH